MAAEVLAAWQRCPPPDLLESPSASRIPTVEETVPQPRWKNKWRQASMPAHKSRASATASLRQARAQTQVDVSVSEIEKTAATVASGAASWFTDFQRQTTAMLQEAQQQIEATATTVTSGDVNDWGTAIGQTATAIGQTTATAIGQTASAIGQTAIGQTAAGGDWGLGQVASGADWGIGQGDSVTGWLQRHLEKGAHTVESLVRDAAEAAESQMKAAEKEVKTIFGGDMTKTFTVDNMAPRMQSRDGFESFFEYSPSEVRMWLNMETPRTDSAIHLPDQDISLPEFRQVEVSKDMEFMLAQEEEPNLDLASAAAGRAWEVLREMSSLLDSDNFAAGLGVGQPSAKRRSCSEAVASISPEDTHKRSQEIAALLSQGWMPPESVRRLKAELNELQSGTAPAYAGRRPQAATISGGGEFVRLSLDSEALGPNSGASSCASPAPSPGLYPGAYPGSYLGSSPDNGRHRSSSGGLGGAATPLPSGAPPMPSGWGGPGGVGAAASAAPAGAEGVTADSSGPKSTALSQLGAASEPQPERLATPQPSAPKEGMELTPPKTEQVPSTVAATAGAGSFSAAAADKQAVSKEALDKRAVSKELLPPPAPVDKPDAGSAAAPEQQQMGNAASADGGATPAPQAKGEKASGKGGPPAPPKAKGSGKGPPAAPAGGGKGAGKGPKAPETAKESLLGRRFDWRVLPQDKVAGTVFADLSGDVSVDVANLRALFEKPKGPPKEKAKAPGKSKKTVELLPSRRAQNIMIALRRQPVTPALMVALEELNFASDALTAEACEVLMAAVPQPDEAKLLCSYRGELSELREAERLLLPLARLERPAIGPRLRLALFGRMADELSRDSLEGLATVRRAADDACSSTAFRTVLRHTERLASIINFGAGGSSDGVTGFSLDALPKLALFRSTSNSKVTLMHVLAAQVSAAEPELPQRLLREIGTVRDAAKRPIPPLADDVAAFSREADHANTCAVSRRSAEDDASSQRLSALAESAKAKATALKEALSSTRDASVRTLRFFAFLSDKDKDTDKKALELFALLSEFLEVFGRAVKEIESNAELSAACGNSRSSSSKQAGNNQVRLTHSDTSVRFELRCLRESITAWTDHQDVYTEIPEEMNGGFFFSWPRAGLPTGTMTLIAVIPGCAYIWCDPAMHGGFASLGGWAFAGRLRFGADQTCDVFRRKVAAGESLFIPVTSVLRGGVGFAPVSPNTDPAQETLKKDARPVVPPPPMAAKRQPSRRSFGKAAPRGFGADLRDTAAAVAAAAKASALSPTGTSAANKEVSL